MKILVAGAHGAVGRLVTARLVGAGHEVRGMVRDPAQAEQVRALGAEPVIADLTRAATLPAAVAGSEAIVFAAGSRGKDLDGVDRGGAMRLIDAAGTAGSGRFIMLSSFFAGHPDEGPEKIRPYLRAKRAADDHLAASRLQYTIVRPGWLTDDAGTGLVTTGAYLADQSGSISRSDVAETLVAALDVPQTVGRAFEVVSGSEPIREALTRLS